MILTADGFATHVKLAGGPRRIPVTGQLTVSFEDLPQTPFQEFNMHFFGSERGLLATPTQCGTYPVNTEFVPWDSELAEQTLDASSSPSTPGRTAAPARAAPRPFPPALDAGDADNTAAAHTPVHAPAHPQRRRPEPQRRSTSTTPPGFSADA